MVSLRIPGPTPCPPQVLEKMKEQMINHRGKEFAEIIQKITARLKEFFQTEGDVLILTASGTGAMEAAIVNALSPGDKVLSVSNGVFGERFAQIAEQFGAEVKPLRFEWGRAADPEEVSRALHADPAIKAVLVTHNETSTGVTNDLASLSATVKSFEKLLLVDAISSLGCIDLPVDQWGCDVVITGSQKGWMAPPGLAMVSVNEGGWRAHAQAKMPRFYWDFAKAKNYLEKGQTPWTPAVSVFYALAVSLELMAEEGLANIVSRHARVGRRTREGVRSLGLFPFPEESCASNTVTAVRVPEGLDAPRLLQLLREEQGVILAGGQERLAGKIFRIGHLGYVTEPDIDVVIEALRHALPQVGYEVPRAVPG